MLSYLFYGVVAFVLAVMGGSFRGSMVFLVIFHWMFYRTVFGIGLLTDDIYYDLYLPLGYILATLAGCVLIWALGVENPISATRNIITGVALTTGGKPKCDKTKYDVVIEQTVNIFRPIRLIVFMVMIGAVGLIFELIDVSLIFPGILTMLLQVVLFVAIWYMGRVGKGLPDVLARIVHRKKTKESAVEAEEDILASRVASADSPGPEPERDVESSAPTTALEATRNVAENALFYSFGTVKKEGVKHFLYSDKITIVIFISLGYVLINTVVFWALITWVPSFWQFYTSLIINGAVMFGALIVGLFNKKQISSEVYASAHISRFVPW